jgi:hypothetical protein
MFPWAKDILIINAGTSQDIINILIFKNFTDDKNLIKNFSMKRVNIVFIYKFVSHCQR